MWHNNHIWKYAPCLEIIPILCYYSKLSQIVLSLFSDYILWKFHSDPSWHNLLICLVHAFDIKKCWAFIFWETSEIVIWEKQQGKGDKRTRISQKTRVKGIDWGMMANIKVPDRKQMWTEGSEGVTGKGKQEGGQSKDERSLVSPKSKSFLPVRWRRARGKNQLSEVFLSWKKYTIKHILTCMYLKTKLSFHIIHSRITVGTGPNLFSS